MAQHGEDYDEDLDDIDFNNYKGFFYADDPGQKYQDKVTGAHFEYADMCTRLRALIIQSRGAEVEEEPVKKRADLKMNKVKKEDVRNREIKKLSTLIDGSQSKQSRNTIQALPQQGFGTVVQKNKASKNNLWSFASSEDLANKKEKSKPSYRETIEKIFRLNQTAQKEAISSTQRNAIISSSKNNHTLSGVYNTASSCDKRPIASPKSKKNNAYYNQ